MAQGGGGPGSGGGGGGSVTPIGDVVNAAGATTDVNATVFSATQANGLIGIGTISNSGANDMIVRETGVDKFGNTKSIETTVLAGNEYLLDPETIFDDGGLVIAMPPYTTYSVQVRSASAGNPTTYELHYVDVAPGSGPGTGGGGPPGTWTKVASGQTPITPGTTVVLAGSLPMPNGTTFIYVPYVIFDMPGGGPLALFPGNTLVAPPANTITYGFESAIDIDFKARSNAGAPPCTLNWVLYKVVPL